MCFCALILSCTLFYSKHLSERCCCVCVDDECFKLHVLAKEDMDMVCCCLDQRTRYDVCDVDRCCCRVPENVDAPPVEPFPPAQVVMGSGAGT